MSINQPELLKQLLNLPPTDTRVFVFDIDSTLYNVSPRNQNIVRHFAQVNEDLPQNIREKLLDFTSLPTDWGIKPGVLRLNLPIDDQKLLKKIRAHWDEHFFGGAFLHHDEEYPGAVDFLKALDKISPVFYLTGRDIPRMGEATESQLEQSGFPFSRSRNQLILKPDKTQLDHHYKLEELQKLKSSFQDIYFFENEPLILNTVFQKLPDVQLFWMNSVHSNRAVIHPDIHSFIRTLNGNSENKLPMSLVLIATPIGNSEDLSIRSKAFLQNTNILIGEEPKACRKILVDQGISPQTKEFYFLNEHTKPEDLQELVEICRAHTVGLISDCGTPGFCDPGALLVKACRQHHIEVKSLPGASSLMTFLSLTGERWDQFSFLGFPPQKKEERSHFFKDLNKYKHPVIFLDAPYRLRLTLENCIEYCAQSTIWIGLDLTSDTEQFLVGSPKELFKKLQNTKAPFVIGIY